MKKRWKTNRVNSLNLVGDLDIEFSSVDLSADEAKKDGEGSDGDELDSQGNPKKKEEGVEEAKDEEEEEFDDYGDDY